MSVILSKDLRLALSINKKVKEHYNRDKEIIISIFNEGDIDDENYYFKL